MHNPRLSRRRFLRAAGSAALGIPAFVPRCVMGGSAGPAANDQIRIGVIGVGIRGKYLIGSMPTEGRIAAISDWYVPRMAELRRPTPSTPWIDMLSRFVDRDAERCAAYADYRHMFDRTDLDAVMVATPDHHHVLAAMLACQAGLDVYVEKAMSLTIAEGRQLVKAVRRYDRVCQVGSQNRSMETNRYGCQLIRTGGIGQVSLVEIANYPGPMTFTGLPAESPPDDCRWDLFCGPTPTRDYHWQLWQKDERQWQGRKWRGWDMWRAYSGHLMTNWGAHSVDMVQAALGADDTGPIEVWPMLEGHQGERRMCPVAARYANGTELRFNLKFADKWTFHGQRGTARMRRNLFATDPPELMVDPPNFDEQRKLWGQQSLIAFPHIQNWLDCIKTRGETNAPVEVGHRSVSVCHLVAIARELGRRLRWDPDREVFPDDEEANALRDRPRRKGWELPSMA